MAEIPLPGTDRELDSDDGLAENGLMLMLLMLGFVVLYAIASGAQTAYNRIVAENTPDYVGRASLI